MNRLPRPSSPWVLLSLAAATGLALLIGQRVSSRVAEVGPLPPVHAMPAERLEVVRLKMGQTFGEILDRAGVGWSEQAELLLAFREQANPRRMLDDIKITLRRLPDEQWLRGVDVALNRDETVRLLRDEVGWSSDMVQTPVWTDTLYAAGVIEDVLSNAVVQNPALAQMPRGNREWVVEWLDQIFQWQVDFSRQVRTGDTYRLTFEREVRPDGSMRAGHILAAEYVNQGTAYRAIWFDPNSDGEGTWYDEDGKSVRRAFLMKPIPLSRISSRYSGARLHPILNTVRAHQGVDFAAAEGTPVEATSDGVVIYADWKGDLGRLVEIRAPNGWVSRYGHLSGFGPGIRVGTRVRQSQVIGRVGMTGLATGPHVHYELRRDGAALDPLSIRLPPGDPVPTTAWGRWAQESQERLTLLETLPGPPIFQIVESPGADSTAPDPGRGGD
jgi:murein DD-endopeptidase MepM/ murein hydrolase activator NlpD